MQFLKCTVAILLAAPVFGSGGNPQSSLTVHEWGTFTTVADAAGGSEHWSPLAGPSDLPCFVQHLHGLQFKSISPETAPPLAPQPVTVRMETPVLYFYSPTKTNVTVAVDFPKGLITEWYPHASRATPEPQPNLPPIANGHIEWDSVEVLPGTTPTLPQGAGASHYYAARNTDAAPIRFGQDQEKLIFYRGIADFSVPLAATIDGDSVKLRNTDDRPLAAAILFENRSGKVGYRIVRGFAGNTQLEAPALTASLDQLKQDLAAALVSQGLYPKEAAAMIETWRDSWFEEGMRVFYLVPRSLVDRELPLRIDPQPNTTARVFVGRVELLSPYMRDRLATALTLGDTQTLDSFGRFLGPFMEQVKVNAAAAVARYLASKATQARQEFYNASCVR